ncbi:hypothetical protein HDU99_001599, partial [Rhizoclosmatium hyalinum]
MKPYIPSPRLPKIKNCEECRRSFKACSKDPDGCVSCKQKGIQCVYLNPPPPKTTKQEFIMRDASAMPVPQCWVSAPTATPLSLSPFSQYSDANLMELDTNAWNSHGSTLKHYLTAMEAPLDELIGPDTSLEDPDLMPTFEDWLLVFNYYSDDGTSFPLSLFMDVESLLREYFQKPAILRFILCHNALKRQFKWSEQPDDRTTLYYFRRARKAFFRADTKPSTDLILSYYFMHIHARDIGEHSLSDQCLNAALKMLVELKMNVDPDDSPWLLHLSPRQKEERRRIFWELYSQYCITLAYLPEPFQLDLMGDKVKLPSQVFDPYPVFSERSIVYHLVEKFESELMNLIGSIRQRFASPPRSIDEMFTTIRSGGPLTDRYLSLNSLIPFDFILQFEDPVTITAEEENLFVAQITRVHGRLFGINMYYHSSISVFYRPIMFLTSVRASQPKYLCEERRNMILNAIKRCVESAWRITSILLFFEAIEFGEGKARVPEDSAYLFSIEGGTLPLFEAYITLWFVACRMDREWVSFAGLEGFNDNALRDRMRRVFEIKKVLGVFRLHEHFVRAMEAMLSEVNEAGGVMDVKSKNQENLESIELGMTAISIGSDRVSITDPWCFMGFLGLEI